MKISSLLISATAILLTQGATASNFGGEEPQIKINSVRAYGSGCYSNENGVPKDWKYKVKKSGTAAYLDFSGMVVRGNDEETASHYCKIVANVSYPEGKTTHDFVLATKGKTNMSGEDYAEIKSAIKMPKQEAVFQWKKLSPGAKTGWRIDFDNVQYTHEAPCGGETVDIEFEILTDIVSNTNSYLILDRARGWIKNATFETGDCD